MVGDGMVTLGIVLLILLAGAALLLPWINLIRISHTERRLRDAEANIQRLLNEASTLRAAAEKKDLGAATSTAADLPALAASPPPKETSVPAAGPAKVRAQELPGKPAEPAPVLTRLTFEQHFGVRLPVWIGGVALALAGFFLVKFSIEQGLLNPTVRVVAGTAFGLLLLSAGGRVRRNDTSPNAFRIAQSLSGAGIAVLYASLFAATTLYSLIPSFVGFGAMAAVTMAALVLSVRHGPPVALLGMLGGFLTPALIRSGDPSAPVLFLYLYFLLTGLMIVIRREQWWLLGLPSIAGAFGWVLWWLFAGNFTPGDTIWLGLFLLTVSATVVASSKRQFESEREAGTADLFELFKAASVLNALTLGGALLIMGVIGYRSGFGWTEWVFFGLLSSGGLGLAFFQPRLYGAVPWLAMAVNAVMLVSWRNAAPEELALTAALFGGLFAIPGYMLQFRSPRPLLWAGLFAAASLGYFLIGYFRLHETPLFDGIQAFWGRLALTLASLSTLAAAQVLRKVPDGSPGKQALLAVFSGTATAFLSLGLAMELRRDFLSVAIAGEMFALAWIGTWLEIKALRYFAALLACVFAFLLLPQILLLIQLTAYGLFEARLPLQKTVPLVESPGFQLGLPALFFGAAAYLFRFRKDDRLIRVFEIAGITLFGLMGYYLTRKAFHVDENVLFVKAGFFERGVVTNAIYVYGLASLWLGRRFARSAASLSGFVLAAIALFRIVYFDLLAYNPIWANQNVGELPVLNSLLLTFGLPILWTGHVSFELHLAGKAWIRPYAAAAMLALAFLLVTFEVRQLFHGASLYTGEVSSLEVYAYSLAWLLLSLVLLFIGTLRDDYAVRIASLLVMILTAGKVFLYDASRLADLTRVLSFLGLGLSLLGISWFYTRFVFRAPAASASGPEA
jgi:uncharacterized membrane protein